MERFTGKVAFITGASSGIGRATAVAKNSMPANIGSVHFPAQGTHLRIG